MNLIGKVSIQRPLSKYSALSIFVSSASSTVPSTKKVQNKPDLQNGFGGLAHFSWLAHWGQSGLSQRKKDHHLRTMSPSPALPKETVVLPEFLDLGPSRLIKEPAKKRQAK